jgi:hypothetical protein
VLLNLSGRARPQMSAAMGNGDTMRKRNKGESKGLRGIGI